VGELIAPTSIIQPKQVLVPSLRSRSTRVEPQKARTALKCQKVSLAPRQGAVEGHGPRRRQTQAQNAGPGPQGKTPHSLAARRLPLPLLKIEGHIQGYPPRREKSCKSNGFKQISKMPVKNIVNHQEDHAALLGELVAHPGIDRAEEIRLQVLGFLVYQSCAQIGPKPAGVPEG
jgi:hypothetical protein